MTRHLLTLILLAGPLTSFAAAGDQSELWHPEYESAASEAQLTGRPVLIHFYADWCGPCRQMEARVLNQRSVLDGLRDRVAAVKVNYDRRADLVSRFGVGALPCDLLVDADGKVLLRTTGYVAETTYVERIERLAPAVVELRSSLMARSFAMMGHFGGAQHLGAVRDVGTKLLVGVQP